MIDEVIQIENPLVIMFENTEGKVITHIHSSTNANRYEHFALLVCDLVRHISKAFNIHEEDVWEWVEQEREHPTTEISGLQ